MGTLELRVQPGARKRGIIGFQGEVLPVRVTAAPEKGKANEAVIELLASALHIPKGRVRLARGASSRGKVVEVEGLTSEEIRTRLASGPPETSRGASK